MRSPFSIVGAQKRVWSITRTVRPLTIPLAFVLAIIVLPLTLVWAVVILHGNR